jgi:hypothetical protein
MKKAQLIIYGLIFVLIVVLVATVNIQIKQIRTLSATAERLENNQKAIMVNSENYLVKQDLSEFKSTLSPRIDSIIHELKVKPKNVERIVERYYFHTDSIIKEYYPEPIDINGSIKYPFIDTTQCFTFGGNLKIVDQKPAIEVNLRKYEDDAVDVYYRERSKKFWFIRYGKWKTERQTMSNCGDTNIKEIEIIRRKKD